LPPFMRQKYVWKMRQLLSPKGILAGLLFDRTFDVSPPFGGSKAEYELLFKDAFRFLHLEPCMNSIPQRANSELFMEFKRNNLVFVNLYNFQGMSCTTCKDAITDKFQAIEGVMNVSISSNFSEVLLVSAHKIPLKKLQSTISYEAKYAISEINY